jgi:hypothetical protein
MPENKTKQTKVSPEAFIKRVASPQQQKDCKELIAMMRKITGAPPKMWGPSIVGFGTRHYVYESGREGDICLTGFSPRKPSLVLYIGEALQDKALMSKLGKYKIGKGCLYLKTLHDVNRDVLQALVTKAVKEG